MGAQDRFSIAWAGKALQERSDGAVSGEPLKVH
jgi:hypothetical protein